MEGEKRKKGLRWWLFGGSLVLLAALAAGYAAGNQLTLEVRLLGAPEMTVEFGEAFSDPGVEAKIYGSRFWKQGITPSNMEIVPSATVDERKTGKYILTYRAACFGLEGEIDRIVRIVDTRCPEIILTEDDPQMVSAQGPYQEAGYKAIDNYDGDITDRVIRTEEFGKILYAVVDSSGNPAYAEREIPGVDLQPPEILLTGGEELTIGVGTVYREPGYSAVDAVEGDVTAFVEVSGEVDWLKPGTYPVTYTVSDSAENAVTVTRTVTVTAKARPAAIWPENKVIYLTFDDGPGPDTRRLLNILDEYGVKATFFVTDSGYPELLEQIVARGHSIGIHTATHRYREIYADAESYFSDLYKMQSVIRDATGTTTTLLRFPGGSSNTVSRKTCEGLMTVLVEAVQDAGFQYFDWNVDSDDAGKAHKKETVRDNVIQAVSQTRVAVVLQHDVHSYSVDAVEEIIIWGLNNGYSFAPLTENSPGMHHSVYN